MRSIYEIELQEIIKVWIFSFNCSNCMITERETRFRYISPKVIENEDDGVYGVPPTIWCDCNEMLYTIQSHGLYDLFESLYEKDEENIIIKLYADKIKTDEDPETFDYKVEK